MITNELFKCEHILDTDFEYLLSTFSLRMGKGLEIFLKTQALGNEIRHYDNTYLVTDISTGELVAFFSLKAGTVSMESIRFFRTKRESIPGIELSNFAVNDNYKEKHKDMRKIGVTVFIDFIIPLVKQAAKIVAAKVIYIFALPEDRLIKYYSSIGFERLDPPYENDLHSRIKPSYDDGCIFMMQNLFD